MCPPYRGLRLTVVRYEICSAPLLPGKFKCDTDHIVLVKSSRTSAPLTLKPSISAISLMPSQSFRNVSSEMWTSKDFLLLPNCTVHVDFVTPSIKESVPCFDAVAF